MSLLPRTQDHLDIIDIKDDTVILSGGKFRMVIEANAINFDLLSEDEQNATIFAYANLVNSIDYPIQIVIRTRQVDVTSYLKFLDSMLHEQPSAALREQLVDYIQFIKQLVIDNTVLQKAFYVVIPHNTGATSGSAKSNESQTIFSLFKKNKPTSITYSKAMLEKAKTELKQKFEELKWQFNRLGIKIRQLNTEELVRLYYEVYNPEAGQNEGVNQDVFGYTSSLVSSVIKETPTDSAADGGSSPVLKPNEPYDDVKTNDHSPELTPDPVTTEIQVPDQSIQEEPHA